MIHAKTEEKLIAAICEKNLTLLCELLHPDNKETRKVFNSQENVKLPRGVKNTRQFLILHFNLERDPEIMPRYKTPNRVHISRSVLDQILNGTLSQEEIKRRGIKW
jgi:hypothetical protein